jgi:zinc protease
MRIAFTAAVVSLSLAVAACGQIEDEPQSDQDSLRAAVEAPPEVIDSLLGESDPALESAELTADDVIEKHIEAIGGKEAYLAVEKLATKSTTRDRGVIIEAVYYRKPPDLLVQTFKLNGVPNTFNTFNGKVLIQERDRAVDTVRDGKILEQFAVEADIHRYTRLDEHGIKVKNMGVADLDSLEAYKLHFVYPSGFHKYSYFDAGTFLHVRDEFDKELQGETYRHIVDFADFEEKEGVLYPRRITTRVAGSEMVADVTDVLVNDEVSESIF